MLSYFLFAFTSIIALNICFFGNFILRQNTENVLLQNSCYWKVEKVKENTFSSFIWCGFRVFFHEAQFLYLITSNYFCLPFVTRKTFSIKVSTKLFGIFHKLRHRIWFFLGFTTDTKLKSLNKSPPGFSIVKRLFAWRNPWITPLVQTSR